MPALAALVGAGVGWTLGPSVKQRFDMGLTTQEAQVSCAVVGAILAYTVAQRTDLY